MSSFHSHISSTYYVLEFALKPHSRHQHQISLKCTFDVDWIVLPTPVSLSAGKLISQLLFYRVMGLKYPPPHYKARWRTCNITGLTLGPKATGHQSNSHLLRYLIYQLHRHTLQWERGGRCAPFSPSSQTLQHCGMVEKWNPNMLTNNCCFLSAGL